MDVQRARSGWATFEEYLHDPVKTVAFWATSLFALGIGSVLYRRNRVDTAQACGGPPPTS